MVADSIDLGGARPQLMSAGLAAGAARVVTMGCGDECPVVSAPVEDWSLRDAPGRPLPAVRAFGDDIDLRLRSLLSTLGI